MPVSVRSRSAIPAAQGVLLVLLALHVAHTAFGFGAGDGLWDGVVYHGLMVAAAAAIIARGVLVDADRAAWLVLGAGALAWSAGDLYYTLVLADADVMPLPSVSDALFLSFYPASWIGLGLLVKRHASEFPLSLRIDAIMGALAASALAVTLLHDTISIDLAGDGAAIATTLAYPIGDVLILAFVTALVVLTGCRPGRTWALIGAALVIGAVGDAAFLFQSANGSYAEGTLLDSVWPASLVLLALAAWQPSHERGRPHLGMPLLALPALFATIAMGLFIAGQIEPLSPLALGLACGTIVALVVRMGVTLAENLRIVEASRGEALTDSLTGLGNRRKLLADLEEELLVAPVPEPSALVLFDLDGFKAYNDGHGHVAGDAVLARLGTRLAAAAEPTGRAYRLGGDEFCVLLRGRSAVSADLHAALADALREPDGDHELHSSYGSVLLPTEADTVTRALHLADQRMYADKDRGRRAPGSAVRQMLLTAMVGASLLLALPAIAGAAPHAAIESGTLVYETGANQTNVLVAGSRAGDWLVNESFTPTLAIGAGCQQTADEVSCVKTGVTRASYLTGDLADSVTHVIFLPATIDTGDGDDWVLAGALADTVRGGGGNDLLNGGFGADTIETGPGDDTVWAQDGTADTINCGTGNDTVDADPEDILVGCGPEPVGTVDETTSGGSGSSGGGGGGASDDGDAPITLPALPLPLAPPTAPGEQPAPAATGGPEPRESAPAPAQRAVGVVQEVLKVAAGVAPLELACPPAEANGCRGVAYLDPAPATRSKGKRRAKAKAGSVTAHMARRGRFGRSPFVIAAGKKGRVRVPLSRSARAALGLPTGKKARAARRGRRVRAVVTVVQRGRRAQRSVVELRG